MKSNINFFSFTDCMIKCNKGFTPDVHCSDCEINDICEAMSPCLNEGVCIVDKPPASNFTCDCKNHFDPVFNCSGQFHES